MRPSKDDFATQQEWIQALAKWTELPPGPENEDRFFMVFDGKAEAQHFLFDGNFADFCSCFFEASEWVDIEAWAQDNNYLLIQEGTDEYDAADEMLDLSEIEEVTDEAIGGKTKSGIPEYSNDWKDN